MAWITNSFWYWPLAFLLSAGWGFYGCNHARNYDKDGQWKPKAEVKNSKEICREDWIETIGIFISEFMGSLAGWYCLFFFYLL